MPQQESRVKKSLLNARVNLIFYFLTLILSFFSRKIFLDTLGADFVGLTGTLQNLLGFLNLAFTIICVNNSKKHLTKRFMGNA